MKNLATVSLALTAGVNGFTPVSHGVGTGAVRMSSPQMRLDEVSSRRSALIGASSLVAAAVPLAAFADANEDAMAAIAARTRQKYEAEKAKAEANTMSTEELMAAQEENKRNIYLALGGSVVLSVPFYFKNLQRLGTKIVSGGKDDGRGGYVEEKKDIGKAASQFFFKRGYDGN